MVHVLANPCVSANFLDVWFMDDGQMVLEPNFMDTFLKILDDELANVGAARRVGPNVKSVARLVGSDAAVAEIEPAWANPYVANTCQLPSANNPCHVLGVDVGDANACG